MKEGLYSIAFGAPETIGFGAIVLKSGRVLGGDSAFYYIGEYSVNGDQATGEARVILHAVPASGAESAATVFGDWATEFRLKFSGHVGNGEIIGTMTRSDMPGLPIPLMLTFREPLP